MDGNVPIRTSIASEKSPPPISENWSLTGFSALAALLPLLASRLLQVPLVALDNFTDAVFYLSYARQFGELIRRYAFPYYATRFGGILPDALSGTLFGDIQGIWMLRWALSAIVSITLFLFFRKRYGRLAGLMASLLWSFNPAALRLLCTTYVDSMAIPFLILGCCLFAFIPSSGWRQYSASFVSGIFLALAASAHLYAAFALLLLIPWLLGALWANRQVLITSLLWMATGFFTTFLIGWLWYWAIWDMPALFSPTMEVMRDLGNGQTALWKKPLLLALHETPAWFAPLLLLLPVLLTAVRGSFLLRGSALSLLASSGFFWGGDLLGNAYALSMPFYYSFLLPVTILAGATLCGELLTCQYGWRTRGSLFLGLMGSVLIPPLTTCFGTLANLAPLSMLALLFLLFAAKSLQRPGLILLSMGAMGVASVAISSTGTFAQFLGHYPRNDIPTLELAAALREALPQAANDARVMRFWYDDNPSTFEGENRRMIGSFWLHVFGQLRGEHDRVIPFPKMSAGDTAALSASGIDRIVILDQNLERISAAEKEIQEQCLPFHLARKTSLTASSDSSKKLALAILERDPTPRSSELPQDIHLIQALHGGILVWKNNALALTSGRIKSWDFACLPLGALKKGERLHIRCYIKQGNILFALNNEDHPMTTLQKWAMPEEQVVTLIAPDDLSAASLSFQSMYPRGSRSQLVITKIMKEQPDDH
jgi:hypothetical protein